MGAIFGSSMFGNHQVSFDLFVVVALDARRRSNQKTG